MSRDVGVYGPHGTRMGRKRTEGTFKDGEKVYP